MWYWVKFFAFFIIACFFILPLFNVEDPFRSFSLRFFSKETNANIYNHSCNPDRIYLYRYQINNKNYEQRYDGYNEILDNMIPADERCKEAVSSLPVIAIKYFPLFCFWSEPSVAERPSIALFLGVNLVKIFSILLLLWTFLRR